MTMASKVWSGIRALWSTSGWIGIVGILGGSPAMALARASFIDHAESVILSQPAHSFLPVLRADLSLVAAIVTLAIAGFFLPAETRGARILRSGIRVLCLLLFLAQAADLLLLRFLRMRLELSDVIRFSREGFAGLTLAVGFQKYVGAGIPPRAIGLGLLALVGLGAAAILSRPGPRTAPRHIWKILVAGAVIATLGAAMTLDATRFHGWAYPNVVAANLPGTTTIPYSRSFLVEADRRAAAPVVSPGENRRLDVIVYVVESLSSSQSELFSGLHDYTPQLDLLARRGRSAPGFFANGYATNFGLIALLTGRIAILSPGGEEAPDFSGFLGGLALPRMLHDSGYHTVYLTTSDLGFTRMGEWLDTLGFDSISGSHDPAYEGMPRFAFDAAPDAALVDQVVRQAEALRKERTQPFLIVAQTASSHMPFVDPTGANHTEAGVIRYVDAQIGRLARELEADGYFEGGILIVVADHRKMAPLEAGEQKRFGLSAFARIPLVMVGAGIEPGIAQGSFQQADLPVSLACFLTAECRRRGWRGSILAKSSIPPRCVFFPMGNDRELVYVRCGDREAMIRLNGDKSRVTEGSLAPGEAEDVLYEIARIRSENVPVEWPSQAEARPDR